MNPFAVGMRQTLLQILNVLLIISSALMIWKGLSVVTNSESPIVVVLTCASVLMESMEPAFGRGDLLFLHKPDRPFRVGDIVVYKLQGKEIPIVHRILNVHNDPKTNRPHILTKGDNNLSDDRGIYGEQSRGKLWIYPEEVVGAVYGYAPYVGYVTIVMNDYPQLKYALLAVLGGFALWNRE